MAQFELVGTDVGHISLSVNSTLKVNLIQWRVKHILILTVR